MVLDQESVNFMKGQIVNILGFMGHTFSVTVIQFCGSGMKTAKEDL